ncbi:MAG: NADH-quinone oxidoreductase subunit L [Deltaproteobacteria bacterium]|nr:MAG: NADH-quinone oxidoreductase subunit L [Deltaproteobacteria bacterium]
MLILALTSLLAPLLCFALLAVVEPLRRRGRLAGRLSALVAVSSFAAAARVAWMVLVDGADPVTWTVHWLVHEGQGFAPVGIHIDGISASMLAVVTLVAACVQVYSLGYMADEPPAAQGRYFAWHSLFIVAMGLLVLAPDLLQLFLGWELVGLCSYLLIGFYWRKPSAGKAAVKAFWVTKFADMGLLLGIIALFGATGTMSWEHPPAGIWALVVPALLFVGVMGKSAQVPLHIWLPDAMEGPTPVSALLHAATMVAAGVFLVVRAYPLFEAAPAMLTFMAWLGAITALVAAVTAVVQDDIKKVLAYSTCSQLGYMVAALGSGHLMGGYFHLTTHAFFKALLFLGAGAAIHAVHSNSIFDMGGLWRKTPVGAALFIVGALALAGVPGFAGFFSKDLILEELLHAGHLGPLLLLVVSAGLTAFYMTRVVAIAFFGEPGARAAHAHEAPWIMLAPMALLGMLALVGGFGGGLLAEAWGQEYHFAVTPVGVVTTLFGLAGIGVGVVRYGTRTWTGLTLDGLRGFILSGPVDRFWDSAWRRGLLPVARMVGWFDRYVVDGLMNLVAVAVLKLGAGVRRLQTGRAQDYVFAVVVGALLFLAYGVVGG